MKDDGDTKDDVKLPEGEVGERLVRMFRTDEKDCSEYHPSMIGFICNKTWS